MDSCIFAMACRMLQRAIQSFVIRASRAGTARRTARTDTRVFSVVRRSRELRELDSQWLITDDRWNVCARPIQIVNRIGLRTAEPVRWGTPTVRWFESVRLKNRFLQRAGNYNRVPVVQYMLNVFTPVILISKRRTICFGYFDTKNIFIYNKNLILT